MCKRDSVSVSVSAWACTRIPTAPCLPLVCVIYTTLPISLLFISPHLPYTTHTTYHPAYSTLPYPHCLPYIILRTLPYLIYPTPLRLTPPTLHHPHHLPPCVLYPTSSTPPHFA